MTFVFVKRIMKISLSIFVLLFALRLAYGFHTNPAEPQKRTSRDHSLNSASFSNEVYGSKQNYASEKIAVRQTPSAAPMDQKYEKTGTIETTTNNMENDDKLVREKIDNYHGIIQYEQKTGGGNTAALLHLLIGIQPASFDEFCKEIQTIGILEKFDVIKTDKTNEFLNLKAKRTSLERSRSALIALKELQGKVDEFVHLQFRILELDQQLQELGILLGDYDEVNEFCSVRMTLIEVREWWEYPPSIARRLMVAFLWTIKHYIALLFMFGGSLLCARLLLGILNAFSYWKNSRPKKEATLCQSKE